MSHARARPAASAGHAPAWLAIVNPRAGHRRSPRWIEAITRRLVRELGAEVVFTQRPGHARALAADAADFAGLAVFGGDGTTADVVNGMAVDRQKLLLLPGGTGNGLARDLGLRSLDAAIAAVRADRLRRLDLIRVSFLSHGKAESKLAISTASIGYAAGVVVLANRLFKSLGALCYPLAATLQAMRQAVFPLLVSIDGSAVVKRWVSNVLVNNTRHAGNFSAFRQADPSDGKMEVLLARARAGPQLLHNLAVLSKTYFYATAAEVQARTLTVDLSTPQRLMIDGEIWDAVNALRFEVLPGRLACVA